MNKKIFIEFDNSKLLNISEKLYNLFLENNYNPTLLDNKLTINEKRNIINKETNSLVISNKLNSNNNTIEIIYPLRSNDTLAKELNNNLNTIVNVTKYYQLRSSFNTSLDYYEILRNINNNEAIIIRYGETILNNSNIINLVFQSINNYLKEENIYTVKSGDSLYSIARKFNTSVDEIKRLNNLTSNNLSINQKLFIPTTKVETPSNNISNNTYTIKSGDSLYSIARKFNTSVDEIKRLNNLTSNNLSINQKLFIPTTIVETPSNNISNNTYTVKSGDSLYSIARKFNTSVDEIKKLNNLTSNNLSINQKLFIPTTIVETPSNNTYTVKSGDSLYSIARKFNTSVDEIKRLNNLTSNNLAINQKLFIP